MKERATTLLCAMAALLLFYVMILRGDAGGVAPDVPRPTSIERAGNGYSALRLWLQRSGYRVQSLTERYNTLLTAAPLTAGDLLIVTLPARESLRTDELSSLDRWMRAGNSLLVLAAIADTPDWAFSGGVPPLRDLQTLSGLDFESTHVRELRRHPAPDSAPGGDADDADASAEDPAAVSAAEGIRDLLREPSKAKLAIVPGSRINRGVHELIAVSDHSRGEGEWVLKSSYAVIPLVLARDAKTHEEVIWWRTHGSGTIIVSSCASLLSNRALGLGDNARWLSNLVAAHVRPGGVVIFDDRRQGISKLYDPQKFYRDRRLYYTLGVLLALWLIWVLGSTQLRTPIASVAVPSGADLVRASGNFFARVLPSHAGARALFEQWFARWRTRGSGEGADSVWQWLTQQPAIAAPQLEQLRRWYGDAYQQRRVPLRNLQHLFQQIDGQIQ